MNIFVLDECPILSAKYQVDKHVVKMITETNQLLCSAFHLNGLYAPYKLTHKNHPSAIWTRESKSNFEWLLKHGFSLSDEYSYRYSKIHKGLEILNWIKDNYFRISFMKDSITDFRIAISENAECRKNVLDFEKLHVTLQYQNYYKYDKQHIWSWKNREIPYFLK